MRYVWRIIVVPFVFVVAGVAGAWFFVFRKNEMDDGRQPDADVSQVAPDDEDDNPIRRWAKDLTPLGRNRAAHVAFLQDGAEMPSNPVPIMEWYRQRKLRRANAR